jgi:hypothetical protein
VTSVGSDPSELFAAIQQQHALTQEASMNLLRLSQSNDLAGRRDAHRVYRQNATTLLDPQRRHNESGWLSPWPLEQVAQPLVQNSMVEADISAAFGEGEEADQLREFAMKVAVAYLDASALARVRREAANGLAAEGRFNESMATLDDLRAQFAADGDVIQVAQTALDQSVVLEWLGDAERALTTIKEAQVGGRRLPHSVARSHTRSVDFGFIEPRIEDIIVVRLRLPRRSADTRLLR